MFELRTTERFDTWLRGLKDLRARARIEVRLDRLALGNAGDAKSVGESVKELRIDYGPGYRVYYLQLGRSIVVLLCGGDKRSQGRDIEAAKALARRLKEQT